MKIIYIILTLLLLVACSTPEQQLNQTNTTFIEPQIQTTAQGVNYLVHPSKLTAGGTQKDDIPSIDQPKYTSIEQANQWLKNNDQVLTLHYNGIQRIYPLAILQWHEIVNDQLKKESIVITYAPLTGSNAAYIPLIKTDNKRIPTTFGTSGELYNSNFLMYDRTTNTLWSQLTGQALVGDLTGQTLKKIDTNILTWADAKAAYPQAQVLSQDTGFTMPYEQEPYPNYATTSTLLFPVDHEDTLLAKKTIVFGIRVNNEFVAYTQDDLKKNPIINDVVGNQKIKITRDEFGQVTVRNLDNGQDVIKQRSYWFAWSAWHPTTLLYTRN